MRGVKIGEISRARWKIEAMDRDLKQNLLFSRLPTSVESNWPYAFHFLFLQV